jgi:hypothetical protein
MGQKEFLPLGMTLGLIFAISFALCVGFGLVAPESFRMYRAWEPLLPGFEFASLGIGTFLLGLLESFGYGLYIAALYVPIYNFLAPRLEKKA